MAPRSRATVGSSFRLARFREHKILWSSRGAAASTTVPPFLNGFFTRFAHEKLRAFPWRLENVPPFHLLLAEVLLLQTKAEDVARVWPELVRRYPTPDVLAKAKAPMLVKLLRPLGLQNQRARSLKTISKTLVDRFSGHVPKTVEGLLSIPHVGLYTAAAVASFGFGRRVPIVDANVLRVLGRVTGENSGRDLRRSGHTWSLAWAILPEKHCARHNYGILDFASLVCTVQHPRCGLCPLQNKCWYGRQQLSANRSRDLLGGTA